MDKIYLTGNMQSPWLLGSFVGKNAAYWRPHTWAHIFISIDGYNDVLCYREKYQNNLNSQKQGTS